jgi:hypothetical protein
VEADVRGRERICPHCDRSFFGQACLGCHRVIGDPS